jgi:hypothetical protein
MKFTFLSTSFMLKTEVYHELCTHGLWPKCVSVGTIKTLAKNVQKMGKVKSKDIPVTGRGGL